MLHSGIEYRSIAEVQSAIADGKTTAKALVEQYLGAIARLDDKLQAITVLNHHALEDVEKLEVSVRLSVPGCRWIQIVLSPFNNLKK